MQVACNSVALINLTYSSCVSLQIRAQSCMYVTPHTCDMNGRSSCAGTLPHVDRHSATFCHVDRHSATWTQCTTQFNLQRTNTVVEVEMHMFHCVPHRYSNHRHDKSIIDKTHSADISQIIIHSKYADLSCCCIDTNVPASRAMAAIFSRKC
jgi:hypothetical protein